MPRIWNGYLCKNNRPIMLYEKSYIKEEQEKGLPEIANKMLYKYKRRIVVDAHIRIFANTSPSAKK